MFKDSLENSVSLCFAIYSTIQYLETNININIFFIFFMIFGFSVCVRVCIHRYS